MTPAARLQMTIEILAAMADTHQPLDRFLKHWFGRRRFAGSGDRRAIAETVFAIQRSRARLAHRMGADGPRALAIAYAADVAGEAGALDTLFGGPYGPEPLSDEERARLSQAPPPIPDWVRGEYPLWLEGELKRAFGDALMAEMDAAQARAPVDLRVNTLKATRPAVLAALAHDGFAAHPTPFSPVGIRIPPGQGSAALARSPLFTDGAFEFQDEAAQLAALLAGARPGQAVLDMAAGAGGKALALAAAMEGRGTILACDADPRRLAPLAERAARAGAAIITAGPMPAAGQTFDLVFVDAPCSGTGTWRRQPELRWRLTPDRLAELTRIQDDLLDRAARYVRPGGMLFYATCSLLPVENQDRVAAFLARRSDFTLIDLEKNWGHPSPPGLGQVFCATPARGGMGGFFAAGLHHV
jgi:16S rRNA (cytosine967-C5)-methyltransferase